MTPVPAHGGTCCTASERTSKGAFLCISGALFAVCAAITIAWCGSMSGKGGVAMPGGWTMSMAWMPMPRQTWLGSAASFFSMWMVMMAAMMLPSLMPMLWRYREAVRRRGELHLARLTTLVGAGYFLVWAAIGVVVFPAGVALAAIEMQLPALAGAVPIGAGAVVVIAGAVQFSDWKAHHLTFCREALDPEPILRADAGLAWRHGLRLGLHCSYCCAGSTTILLVIGVMDLRAMAVVTAANTLERFAPRGGRVARVLGTVAIGAGLFMISRAIEQG